MAHHHEHSEKMVHRLSLLIFMEMPSAGFMVALLVMIAGTYVVTVADHC